VKIPSRLAATCSKDAKGATWLARLPAVLRELAERWSLTLAEPFDSDEVSCSWVAPAKLTDGTGAVLKLGIPHMEGEHEIDGLRFWNGDPTVRLLAADDDLNVMLIEECDPGTALRALPEPEQDVVLAQLLRRLWRRPAEPHRFRPLSAMAAYWSSETLNQAEHWPDSGLVRAGLELFRELPENADEQVLLATDLHAGNVLRAKREPWLLIDPKPFFGDPAYDATQHLFNCDARMRVDAENTMRRFAELAGLEYERVRLWMFARAAAEPRTEWQAEGAFELARALAP
jgi:streptomycin 6-kinase